MKKMFPSEEKCSRIGRIDTYSDFDSIFDSKYEDEPEVKMKGKKSKVLRVVALSVSGFLFGISLTGLILYTTIGPKKETGVGGLETQGIPNFDNFYGSSDIDNVENSNSDDVLYYEDLDSSENNDNVLTYETYRVQSGDMISVIADKYGVTQDTIISVNNIKQSRLIQPGQYLKVPSMTGIIYTAKKDGETIASISETYEVNAEKCALVNYVDPTTIIPEGKSIFVPDAELDWMTRQEINGDLFKNPLRCRYWLSSPYGWRDSPFNPGKRSFHTGIDMATSQGNSVYPAMDGVVELASYGHRVYGNYVVIRHHSGYKTLYGHLSTINCRVGNYV